jgi:hypothetical protein
MPNSWLQWHSVWHLMMAIAYFLVYLFFRSDLILDGRGNDARSNTAAEGSGYELKALSIKVLAKGVDDKAPQLTCVHVDN